MNALTLSISFEGDSIDHVYWVGVGAIVCYYPKVSMSEIERAQAAPSPGLFDASAAREFNQTPRGRVLTTKQLHEHAVLAEVRRVGKWAGLNDLLSGDVYRTSAYVGGSVAYLKMSAEQVREWLNDRFFSTSIRKEFDMEFWRTHRELALRTYGDNTYQVFRLCEYLAAHVESRAHAAKMSRGSAESPKEVKIVGNYMRIAFHLGTLESQIREVIKSRFLKGTNPILTKSAKYHDDSDDETEVSRTLPGNTLDRMTYWIQIDALQDQLAKFRRFNAVLHR